MADELPARRKWELLLAGGDPGPMVSPLCDDWSLDVPYHWPLAEPDPFPPGHPKHTLSQQMAMAEICGWEPTFLCTLDMPPRDPQALPRMVTSHEADVTRTTSVIHTPYGELTSITETLSTSRALKPWIETEADFHRMSWVARRIADYDEDAAVEQGRVLRAAVGDRGMLGTWFGPPIGYNLNRDAMFYHLADWPEAFEELHQATRALAFRQIETLRKAGFDYLFYCVDATEWISPDFFRRWILEDTRRLFARWHELGGFVLWHSCGKVATFLAQGFYNDLAPDVLETLSEAPLGDLPSLRWARDRLDRKIITKGNIGLDILLGGTEEEVRREVSRVRGETAGYRHVVGLSDDILKGTPLRNARALVEESRASIR